MRVTFLRCETEGIPFRIPAICCQEVLQGVKNEREWRKLSDYLGTQEMLEPSADSWTTHQAAARIFFDCRRKGLTIRSTIDCLIAEAVLQLGDVLLHDDEDFEHIRRVRPLKTLL